MKILSCTNQDNGTEYTQQKWRRCLTCDSRENIGVCIPCSESCHAGHRLGPIMDSAFFCDCGAGSLECGDACKCYTQSMTDMVVRAISNNCGNILESQLSLSELKTPVSPHLLFISLGVLASINDCSYLTRGLTNGVDSLLLYADSDPKVDFACGVFGISGMEVSNGADGDETQERIDSQLDSPWRIVGENAKDYINEFVKERTKGEIGSVIDFEPEEPIMISAFYLNIDWKYNFDPALTTDIEFVGKNGSIFTPMMRVFPSEMSLVMSNDKFLSVAFQRQSESFVIMTLPHSDRDIRQDIEMYPMQYLDHLNLNDLSGAHGSVVIPKFKKEFTLDVMECDELESNGLDVDDLIEVTGVSDIIHKTVIEINETSEGAETPGRLYGLNFPTQFEWIGNKPFAMAIINKSDPLRNGTLLFQGIIDLTI